MYTWHANKTNERMTSYLCICYVTSKLSWFLFCRWERTDKQQPFTYRVTSDYTHHRLHTGAIGSYCHELFKKGGIKKIKSYASVGIRTSNPWV